MKTTKEKEKRESRRVTYVACAIVLPYYKEVRCLPKQSVLVVALKTALNKLKQRVSYFTHRVQFATQKITHGTLTFDINI